jgi:Sec-independent protein translocase protein TatA
MGNSLGKTIREFRKASSDVTDAVSLDQDTKPAAQQATASTASPAAAAPAPAESPAPAQAPADTTVAAPAPAESPAADAAEGDYSARPKSDDA